MKKIEETQEYKTKYVNTNNDKYIIKKEYKPTELVKTEYNYKTNKLETKRKTINHELDWENEAEMLRDIITRKEKIKL